MAEVSSENNAYLIPCIKSLKRTYDLFHATNPSKSLDMDSQRIKLYSKVADEYEMAKELPSYISSRAIVTKPDQSSQQALSVPEGETSSTAITTMVPAASIDENQVIDGVVDESEGVTIIGGHSYPSRPGVSNSDAGGGVTQKVVGELLQSLPTKRADERNKTAHGLVEYRQAAGLNERINPPTMALARTGGIQYVKPEWHAPWKLMRVVSGHTGWVRSIAIDSSNEWFATGSGDRTIKIWDLASGVLKLTLTGHIGTVMGLAISDRHPYLFSCGDDKQIKCWDLEYNKTIRQYHGHLSAVYCLAMHPTIDLLCTGGRDSTVRVWDMRTKAEVFVLTGHSSTVASVDTQAADPQIMSGSADSTVKLWDLAAGRCAATLTNHKKSVRALVNHPSEYSFASVAADNIKVWKHPHGQFIRNISGHNAIVNCATINQDNVLVTGGDNGSMYFWDWKTGYNFQQHQTTPQPGSLDSEAGIYAVKFDKTGTRLFSCEADKSIKVYKEDEDATPETHPVKDWRPSRNRSKF
jgi:pleiotropic regulator 1